MGGDRKDPTHQYIGFLPEDLAARKDSDGGPLKVVSHLGGATMKKTAGVLKALSAGLESLPSRIGIHCEPSTRDELIFNLDHLAGRSRGLLADLHKSSSAHLLATPRSDSSSSGIMAQP